jgi:tetrahydromethanopterin S-methyltransferase subunit E
MITAFKALFNSRKFGLTLLGTSLCGAVGAGLTVLLNQLSFPPDIIANIVGVTVGAIGGLFGLNIAGQAFEDGKQKQAQGVVAAATVTAESDPKMINK